MKAVGLAVVLAVLPTVVGAQQRGTVYNNRGDSVGTVERRTDVQDWGNGRTVTTDTFTTRDRAGNRTGTATTTTRN